DGDITGLKVGAAALASANDILLDPVAIGTGRNNLAGNATAFGKANLAATGDNTQIAADAGNVVLIGTATQGVAALTAAADTGIALSGRGVSADSLTASSGNILVSASEGTLALGAVSAQGSVRLDKQGTAAAPGNGLRFVSISAAGDVGASPLIDPLTGERTAVLVTSQTSVSGGSIMSSVSPAMAQDRRCRTDPAGCSKLDLRRCPPDEHQSRGVDHVGT
ncbi:MAG TPA: hypothetical protein PKE25_11040, partial [Novosphingobium sp.]|nr:hypothetical protein [Novosphingobium sp.]